MNYHKDTSYLLEPEQLNAPSKHHLNGFETAYGLQVNDEEKGEPLLMQRFRKRAQFRPETVEIQVEENGHRIRYVAPKRNPQPVPAPGTPPRPHAARPEYPLLPFWAERYRSELQPVWRLNRETSAERIAPLLFEKFTEFLRLRDFLGAEAVLLYLNSGAEVPAAPPNPKRPKKKRRSGTEVRASFSSEIRQSFERYRSLAQANPEYLRQRQALRFQL